jgi:hypothetical protein
MAVEMILMTSCCLHSCSLACCDAHMANAVALELHTAFVCQLVGPICLLLLAAFLLMLPDCCVPPLWCC